ncbi:hypothetical protein FQN50_008564 [Emmonsiellopsis sp. PD_5]|nr:hypothetical protein FQN50_008564 [Emmonsiellopsis sp. PD_5]
MGALEEEGIGDVITRSPQRVRLAEGSWDMKNSKEHHKKPADSLNKTASRDLTLPEEHIQEAQVRREEVLKHFRKTFSDANDAKKRLSNPETYIDLPFPYAGLRMPDRFKEGRSPCGSYCYMGREEFARIADSFIDVLRGSNALDLWLYGPIGYGKSHILATLMYYLTSTGHRVIYIPDCGLCFRNAVTYVQDAVFFAWADDRAKLDKILSFRTLEDIAGFMRLYGKDVTFIIDQVNPFTPDDMTGQNELNEKIRGCLDRCRGYLPALLSTSANNSSFMSTRHRHSNEKTIYVQGGFSDSEMAAWWERRGIRRGNYSLEDLEDYTGRIPLFLDDCTASGKWDFEAPEITWLMRSACQFVDTMKDKLNDRRWEQYLNYVRCCIAGNHVDDCTPPTIIDDRFFFEVDGVGKCICGAARTAVSKHLIGMNESLFTVKESLDAIRHFINNLPVIGFFLESVVLESIASQGLQGLGLRGPMKQIVFRACPTYNLESSLSLYIPRDYNHPAIDALVLHYQKTGDDEPVAHLYPIQITIANRHKDSEEELFSKWDNWTRHLGDCKIKVTFLRITSTEDYESKCVVEKFPPLPGNSDPRLVHPECEVMYLPLSTMNTEAWKRARFGLGKEGIHICIAVKLQFWTVGGRGPTKGEVSRLSNSDTWWTDEAMASRGLNVAFNPFNVDRSHHALVYKITTRARRENLWDLKLMDPAWDKHLKVLRDVLCTKNTDEPPPNPNGSKNRRRHIRGPLYTHC